MPRSSLWIGPLLLALPVVARGDDAPTFWRENTLAAPSLPSGTHTPVSRAQFFGAAAEQISFVGALKEWRETLRGQGPRARRELWHTDAGGHLALALGRVNVPAIAGLGAPSGTALSWSGKGGASLEAGTSARPVALDEALQHFDSQTDGDGKTPSAPLERASLTWLRARPVAGKAGEVEATLLRAIRSDAGAARGGDFENVAARMALPARWSLRGSWTNAQLDGHDAATSWNTAASGPLSHPFGEASVALAVRATDAGFATLTSQNGRGERAGDAQITQGVQIGAVSGSLAATASSRTVADATGAASGTELARDAATAGADLKVQLAPALALKASASASNTQTARAPDNPTAPARETLTGAGGDVGLEVKVSKALSLEVGGGLSGEARTFGVGHAIPTTESRATMRLRHHSSAGSWSASLQARDRDEGTTAAPWTHIADVGLESERHLVGGLRVRAKLNYLLDRAVWGAGNTGAGSAARLAEAQFSLTRAARLDVRYRDGAALPTALQSDPLGALFSSSFVTGGHELATRCALGAAASGGNGFGMALEWARTGAASATDTWKIGLTYR